MNLDRKNKVDKMILDILDAQDSVTHSNEHNQREALDDAKHDREIAVNKLKDYINTLYEEVTLEEGAMVVYVGVLAVRWQSNWCEPTIGFKRAGD